MTDLKHDWPLSVEALLVGTFPLLLTYTSYATTANFVINSEDDLVDHMLHFAKVLVDSGTHSNYDKWDWEAYFQERMGFSFGFYTDVFGGKPNRAMVGEVKSAAVSVQNSYRKHCDHVDDCLRLHKVIQENNIGDAAALWRILFLHKAPSCDTPMLQLTKFATIA